MLLKKKCLERFIKKIENRPHCSFDRESMSATMGTDGSTWMHVFVRDDLHGSPEYSVIVNGPGGYGDPTNIGAKKAPSECKKILEQILKELEEEGC